MFKIVLVEKYSISSHIWPILVKRNNFHFSIDVVVKKFQGFEGEGIQFCSETGHTKFIQNNNERVREEPGIFTILCVSPITVTIPQMVQESFRRVGFDFGVCEEDATTYSSIFNEVLFGVVEGLISFKDDLNDNLLFSDIKIAQIYANKHRELLNEGKDVEHDEEMKIYDIWQYVAT